MVVVAPASPFPWTEACAGLAWLRSRYGVVTTSRIFQRRGYLAGSDEARAEELAAAFERDDVAAIVCARGGYGIVRLLDRLPWERLVARPKWLVGFSDVTALHVEANQRGLASLHGPNVTGLARDSRALPKTRLSLLDALEGRQSPPLVATRVLRAGAAQGIVFGGNLTLLATLAAAGRLSIPVGAIVVLEDVTERPYRIDRMLESLRLGGHLARASALAFGEFAACEPGPDGVTVEAVLADLAGRLDVPVVSGLPFGHGNRNESLRLGTPAALADGALRFAR